MTEVEERVFFSGGLEYTLKWITSRHYEILPRCLAKKLLTYYDFLCSSQYPERIFKENTYTRCSSFRLKGLRKNASKIISNELIKYKLVDYVDGEGQISSRRKYDKHILSLSKMASIWYEIYHTNNNTSVGHELVLNKILQLNPLALSTEISVWTSTHKDLRNGIIPYSEFICYGPEIITGHIDLLLFDPVSKYLFVADYKPENHFLRSLPQVATYGLMVKHIFNYERVMCMSFSREKAWIYNPELIRNELPELITYYGDPPLEWRRLVNGIH